MRLMTRSLDLSYPADAALAPEPGWAALGDWPFPHGKPGRFVVGDDTQTRFAIRYYRDADDADRLHGKIWFGPGTEGPPLHAHGGAMAAVLDELVGVLCWASGRAVLAAQLDTTFHAMLPVGSVVRGSAWIEGTGRRSIRVRAALDGADGTRYASAAAVFVQLTPEAVAETTATAAARASALGLAAPNQPEEPEQ